MVPSEAEPPAPEPEQTRAVRTPHRDRVFAFRDFILATYSLEYLQGGGGGGDGWILDVAGGKGDLSWLFANGAPRLRSVIVDPRVTDHKKVAAAARWHWEHHRGGLDAAALAGVVAERGPQGRLGTMGLAPPYRPATHLRAFLDAPMLSRLADARAGLAAGESVIKC
jgi:hypothetical protein